MGKGSDFNSEFADVKILEHSCIQNIRIIHNKN